jgi:hypothetical protein
MKFASTIIVLLAAGAVGAAAQNASSFGVAGMENLSPAPNHNQQTVVHTTVLTALPVDTNCPVSMRAEHLSDGEMVKTRDAKPQGIGQSLHLTFIARDSRRIASAALTIQGVNPKGRVMQASATGGGSPEATAKLTVEFTPGPERRDLADIRVPGMTAVQSIEVNSVGYSDGSTWKLAGSLHCRVAPDGLMLVSNR